MQRIKRPKPRKAWCVKLNNEVVMRQVCEGIARTTRELPHAGVPDTVSAIFGSWGKSCTTSSRCEPRLFGRSKYEIGVSCCFADVARLPCSGPVVLLSSPRLRISVNSHSDEPGEGRNPGDCHRMRLSHMKAIQVAISVTVVVFFSSPCRINSHKAGGSQFSYVSSFLYARSRIKVNCRRFRTVRLPRRVVAILVSDPSPPPPPRLSAVTELRALGHSWFS